MTRTAPTTDAQTKHVTCNFAVQASCCLTVSHDDGGNADDDVGDGAGAAVASTTSTLLARIGCSLAAKRAIAAVGKVFLDLRKNSVTMRIEIVM